MPDFDGDTFDPGKDGKRLGSNFELIRAWFRQHPGQWATADTIALGAGVDPRGAVKERIRDLRKPKFGAHDIKSRRTEDPSVWEYCLVVTQPDPDLTDIFRDLGL